MAATSPARAQFHVSDAVYIHPSTPCVEKRPLAEQISSWLGESRVDPALRIEVYGSEEPRVVGFRLLRSGTVIAERRFAPPPSRCDHLHAALGLAVALALKAQLLEEILGAALPAAPRRLSLSADARATWNVLPGSAFGAGFAAEYPLGRGFTVAGGLFGLISGRESLPALGGEGDFQTTLVAAEIDGCVTLLAVDAVDARLCTGLTGGVLRASGRGYDVPRSAVMRWFAVSETAAVTVALAPRWSLRAALGLIFPLQATAFELRTVAGTPVANREPDPFGIGGAVGPRYEF